ncbi:hypothetical protein GOE08_07615 [Sinorhizobium medicae]|nr:hypothetical protein [Sinorhizobium medicae]
MADKLSDDQVYERLHAAYLALGREEGETVRGDTALKAARRALTLLQMGHVAAQDSAGDKNHAIKAQDDA